MKKEITLGNLLGILVPVFVLLLGWGISINSRLVNVKNNTNQINKNETKIDKVGENASRKIDKVDDKVDENFKEVQRKLDRIIENQNR